MSNLLFFINSIKGRAMGYMILSSACWGFATVMSKRGLQYIPPLHLLAIQLASSITFLWIIMLIVNQYPSLSWKTIKYGITGVLEPGLAYTFAMMGLALTTASSASLISTTEPIIIILISWLLLREQITRLFLFFTGLSFAGVILIVLEDVNIFQVNHSSWLGDILIFIGTLCASFYVVLSHKIIENNNNLSPLSLATIQQTAGFILITIILFTRILGSELMNYSSLNLGIWVLAIISGIIQYALAFWFYLMALKEVTASTAALFLTLVPVFGISAAYWFLGEKLTILEWLGAILILTSVLSISLIQYQNESKSVEQ